MGVYGTDLNPLHSQPSRPQHRLQRLAVFAVDLEKKLLSCERTKHKTVKLFLRIYFMLMLKEFEVARLFSLFSNLDVNISQGQGKDKSVA